MPLKVSIQEPNKVAYHFHLIQDSEWCAGPVLPVPTPNLSVKLDEHPPGYQV